MDFFKEKVIIDKNLTIFHVNCDSLQLYFSRCVWIVVCLMFCNLSVSTFTINSFSITFICLSPWISAIIRHNIKAIKGFRCRHVSNILLIISNILRQFSFYWNWPIANKFLKLPNHYNRVVVTRKRVNRDIGLGLEIRVDYSFHVDNRVTEWFKKFIEKFDKFTDVKVEECMKNLRNLFIH